MLSLMKILPSILALLGQQGGITATPIKVFLDIISKLPQPELEKPIVPIDVKAAQDKLNKLGFDPGPVDGWPGVQTMAAVKKFQESRHLTVDGLIGQATWRALQGEA
jgi:peptidoglycan hydrolase-like protein with peptidoglycan-binding domain